MENARHVVEKAADGLKTSLPGLVVRYGDKAVDEVSVLFDDGQPQVEAAAPDLVLTVEVGRKWIDSCI